MPVLVLSGIVVLSVPEDKLKLAAVVEPLAVNNCAGPLAHTAALVGVIITADGVGFTTTAVFAVADEQPFTVAIKLYVPEPAVVILVMEDVKLLLVNYLRQWSADDS